MKSTEWIRYSGLAEAVGCNAWAVFREIVDRDCHEHPLTPGDIRCSLADLGKAAGLTADQAGKAIKKLVRGRYIRAFVPDNFIEECLIQVSSPLATPVPVGEIQKSQQIGLDTEWRYARADEQLSEPVSESEASDESDRSASDSSCGGGGVDRAASEAAEIWLVDRIMGVTAGAVNAFTLDRVRWIAAKWSLEEIKRAWETVRKWGKPSLYALERALIGRKPAEAGKHGKNGKNGNYDKRHGRRNKY